MTVNYPTLAFAFNPISIEVTDIGINEPVFIIIPESVVSKQITLERQSGTRKVVFDLQGIAQSIFDRKEFYKVLNQDAILYKKLSFKVKHQETIENIEIDIIWGALQIGEIYTQNKTLTWFKNLPFTFPLYLSQSKQVLARYDNNQYSPWKELDKGKYNLSVPYPDANKKVVIRVNAGNEGGIFDYTFDYTFRGISRDTILISLLVNECTDGVYLRWINKQGEYCYYLFNTGTESNAISNGDVNIIEHFNSVESQDNHHIGTNSIQSKDGQRSVRLFAHLVDKETYIFLESLLESVVIDLFKGYDENNQPLWIGVNVAPGTSAKDRFNLQDFECSLIYPKTFTQSL